MKRASGGCSALSGVSGDGQKAPTAAPIHRVSDPKNRHKRKETERFNCFTYDELLKRDKVNLDIFRLKDESLEQFATIAEDLEQ